MWECLYTWHTYVTRSGVNIISNSPANGVMVFSSSVYIIPLKMFVFIIFQRNSITCSISEMTFLFRADVIKPNTWSHCIPFKTNIIFNWAILGAVTAWGLWHKKNRFYSLLKNDHFNISSNRWAFQQLNLDFSKQYSISVALAVLSACCHFLYVYVDLASSCGPLKGTEIPQSRLCAKYQLDYSILLCLL